MFRFPKKEITEISRITQIQGNESSRHLQISEFSEITEISGSTEISEI
jgi:hypothetical protein